MKLLNQNVLAFLLASQFVLAAGCGTVPTQEAEEPERPSGRIAAQELKRKLESGEKFLLIDVREDRELEADGAIAGAIHIPVAELDERMKDIPKDVEIVFY